MAATGTDAAARRSADGISSRLLLVVGAAVAVLGLTLTYLVATRMGH